MRGENPLVLLPTFPVGVLMAAVAHNNHKQELLFEKGTLMSPNVTSKHIIDKIEAAKKQRQSRLAIQSLELCLYQFNQLSGLPDLQQLNLTLII